MKNKELQELLAKYPDDLDVRYIRDFKIPAKCHDITHETVIEHSEGAWIDDEAPEDEWDTEEGKLTQEGTRFIILNAPVY